jgi:hypothetical protein
MSDRDPPRFIYRQNASEHSSAHPVIGNGVLNRSTPNYLLNPAASQFQPSITYSMPEVSQSSPYHLERKVNDLQCEQDALRTEIEDLKALCNTLHSSLDTLKKGGWDVKVGPFKGQSAAQFQKDPDALLAEAKGDNHVANNYWKTSRAPSVGSNTSSSMPPHLKSKTATENKSTSLPPHLRKSAVNGSVTSCPSCHGWSINTQS